MKKLALNMVAVAIVLLAACALIYGTVASAEASVEEFCYTPYGTEVKQEFKAKQTLVVVNYLEQERGETVESSWLFDHTIETSLCEVWIRVPDQVLGDPDMDGIGHEFLHCIFGDFHPETPHE